MNIKILLQYLSKQRKQIDKKNLAMIYDFAASAYWLLYFQFQAEFKKLELLGNMGPSFIVSCFTLVCHIYMLTGWKETIAAF